MVAVRLVLSSHDWTARHALQRQHRRRINAECNQWLARGPGWVIPRLDDRWFTDTSAVIRTKPLSAASDLDIPRQNRCKCNLAC